MVPLASPTHEQLLQRRRLLRQQRRSRFWQGSWRLTSSMAVLALLVLGLRQPYWQIRQPEQIQVEGADWVDPAWIRSQLPLRYPLDIWQVQPAVLEGALLGSPTQPSPIESVQVRRRLLPVGVIVQVRERQPIARAMRDDQLGLVDIQGNWVALNSFRSHALDRSTRPLPQLELLGWESHTPEQWALLLKALQQLEIQIEAVDWQGGGAITLRTELGNVYLGPISDRLALQIQTLNQMRDLRRYCDCTPDQIVHIDLTSPTVPTLQLTPSASQERWQLDLP
ncbi:FtsQ-type POTRA domain-containing protein [Synechococcus sp. Nb3U1]|uniref:cell division protein FtsQ/DivIB n=1 Tax=Synechococcus sp. Nb3U1 TaxID=1914529 RepID=UPI001F27C696|nr:FtsQ-type POTRA domain-containing protein [Synechococcus sp. Nb3U1]MCF2970161.1 FtsQ-type POTRA domain-containing protein [Synechococcus sp. Nb3U1]